MRRIAACVGLCWMGLALSCRSDPAPDTQWAVVGRDPPAASSVSAQLSVSLQPAGASSVMDVRFCQVDVSISGAAIPAEVSVQFIAPTGVVYQTQTDRVVRADPAIQQDLEFILPVAGTSIDQTGLSGTWIARAFMDGIVIHERSFVLSP